MPVAWDELSGLRIVIESNLAEETKPVIKYEKAFSPRRKDNIQILEEQKDVYWGKNGEGEFRRAT